MECWHCGGQIPLPAHQKISFRATCDHCTSWLHCCRNCKNFQPGLPNDCKIPGTEYIADRESMNYCDEFALLSQGPKEKPKVDKNRFNSLFKEE